MASMYPLNMDKFRAWVHDGGDDMVAAHLNVLLDSLVAIETELGVSPSGISGTIFGRLLHNGNVSLQAAGWNRLQWANEAAGGNEFARDTTGRGMGWKAGVHDKNGQASIWGDMVPACFAALQSPLMSGAGAQSRGAVPWRLMTTLVNEIDCRFAGYDGQGAELSTTNARACQVAVLTWSLKT